MASKKKEEKLKFMQMPLPSASVSGSKLTKVNWSGLNRRYVTDSGELSDEVNISTKEAPYLTPCEKPSGLSFLSTERKYSEPLGIFSYDNIIVVIYRDSADSKYKNSIKADIIYTDRKSGNIMTDPKHFGENAETPLIHTVLISENNTKDNDMQRSCAVFNSLSGDAVTGEYKKTLLIFPDRASVPLKFIGLENGADMETVDSLENADKTGKTIYYTWYAAGVKRYYRYVNGEPKQIGDGEIHGENNCYIFPADSLDVKINTFYNDGYTQASGVYKNGYFKTPDISYNPEKKYYIFVHAYNLLKLEGLKEVHFLEEETLGGDELAQVVDDVTDYYEYDPENDTYTKTSDRYAMPGKTYYRYFTEDTYVPMEEIIRNANSKTSVSGYYEQSDEDKGRTYYKKQNNTYTAVPDEKIKSGDNVSEYYIFTNDYAPKIGKAQGYYKNTYPGKEYVYIYSDEESKWIVTQNPACPKLKYITTHLGRLCGVDDSRVYVSGFGDNTNWTLDAADDSNEKNAWVSMSQSNSSRDGNFSGIAVYDNHVLCFKKDYMHEIYGTKNPFRLYDIYADGTIDNRSIREVAGRLIFVSDSGVKMYTGSAPKDIGYKLGCDKFTDAVSGSDGRFYYLFCYTNDGRHLFVYDVSVGEWAERGTESDVIGFASNDTGMYMLCRNGYIYRLSTKDYSHSWSFETDITANKTANIKHIRKIQLMAEFKSGASLKIYGIYQNSSDGTSSGKEVLLYESPVGILGRHAIRFKPRMTAECTFKLRFEGSGYIKLYQMETGITGGGELFN